LRCRWQHGGGGDNDGDDNDVGEEEQDMMYADTDALSCDQRREEGGEGDIDDSGDNKHVDGPVCGPRQVDTGDGRLR